jgi:hypothetical protein
MFDRNLERVAELEHELAMKEVALEWMLREAGIDTSHELERFFAGIIKRIRSTFSQPRGVIKENRRDLKPCPECP